LDKLQKQSIDMKRSALLLDRKRIESKVNETIEMTRRSKLKSRRLMFIKRIEDMRGEGEIITSKNLDSSIPVGDGIDGSKKPSTTDDSLLNRNVSVSFLTRQLGGAVDLPKQKNRRIHKVDNVYRDLVEGSYDLHGEHDDCDFLNTTRPAADSLFVPKEVTGLSPQERAELYYVNFSSEEKLELIEQKIHMLQERMMAEEIKGSIDPLTAQLMDLLAAAKAAHLEEQQEGIMKKEAEVDRDDDI